MIFIQVCNSLAKIIKNICDNNYKYDNNYITEEMLINTEINIKTIILLFKIYDSLINKIKNRLQNSENMTKTDLNIILKNWNLIRNWI